MKSEILEKEKKEKEAAELMPVLELEQVPAVQKAFQEIHQDKLFDLGHDDIKFELDYTKY